LITRGVLSLRSGVQFRQADDSWGIPLYFVVPRRPPLKLGLPGRRVRLWGEPREAVASRMAAINEVAAKNGRTLRYSLSLRPIIADTESDAWEKAEWIAEKTAERIEMAKAAHGRAQRLLRRFGGDKNATYSVDRKVADTTSVGRKRLIEMSATKTSSRAAVMKVANLTGAAGNSTHSWARPSRCRGDAGLLRPSALRRSC